MARAEQAETASPRGRRASVAAHLAIPACLSGLLLVVSFPLILRLAPRAYEHMTGRSPARYLTAWVLFTVAVFLASGIVWLVRVARRR